MNYTQGEVGYWRGRALAAEEALREVARHAHRNDVTPAGQPAPWSVKQLRDHARSVLELVDGQQPQI